MGSSLRWPPTPGKKTGGVFDGRELVLDAGSLRRKPSAGSQVRERGERGESPGNDLFAGLRV